MKKLVLVLAVASVLTLTGCRTHRPHHDDRDFRDRPEQFDPNRHPDYDNNRPPMGREFTQVKGMRQQNVRGEHLYEANGVYYRQVNDNQGTRYRVVGYRDNR